MVARVCLADAALLLLPRIFFTGTDSLLLPWLFFAGADFWLLPRLLLRPPITDFLLTYQQALSS